MDTTSWHFFKISTIFDVTLSKGDLKEGEVPHGNIPLVSSGESNNGIVDYIDENGDGKAQIFPGECITVDMFCQAYYQPKPFYAVSHGRVNILLPKIKLGRNILLFLCAVINHEKYRFSYGRAVYSNVIKMLEVKLPVDKENKIDWKWIEKYMCSIDVQIPETHNNSKNIFINTDNWKYFNFGKLIDRIYKAKAHAKIDETMETDISENSVFFVTRTEINNGCDGYISREELDGIESENALIIGDTTSTCFYQPKEFAAGDHIVVCRASWMNKYTALFVKAILEKERYRYSYGRAFKVDLIKNTNIFLPATPTGEPDWNYMENYIKSLPYGDCI